MRQLEIQILIHTDGHMFAWRDFYQAEPKIVIASMTQLSLNAGFKEWGDKPHSSAKELKWIISS